jgi:hypothetical protein
VVLCISYASADCTIQDNTDYNNGFLVSLFSVPNATACCNACGTFGSDCAYWSYTKDPNAGEYYQRCYIKNKYQATTKVTSNSNVAGPTPNVIPPPINTCGTVEQGFDYNNGWLSLLENVPDQSLCCDACANYAGCKAWSYTTDPAAGAWYHRCFLKASNSNRTANNGTVAGTVVSVAPPPVRTSKTGVAWFNTEACTDLAIMKGVSWYYNWGTLPDVYTAKCSLSLGIEYVPMVWGTGSLNDLNLTVWGGSKYIVAFNEPNFYAQSNVSPAQAAKLWPQLEAIAKPRGMKIGSPSASACGPVAATDCYGGTWSPIQWFDDFFSNCTGCQVDFITTHIYTCDLTELQTYLTGIITRYNKPVWLSEFACPAAGKSIDVETTFMKGALAFLESNPMIQRYAWFGTRLPLNDGWLGPQVDLLNPWDSSLSPLGVIYNQ